MKIESGESPVYKLLSCGHRGCSAPVEIEIYGAGTYCWVHGEVIARRLEGDLALEKAGRKRVA